MDSEMKEKNRKMFTDYNKKGKVSQILSFVRKQ